jgi:hypothetical protein
MKAPDLMALWPIAAILAGLLITVGVAELTKFRSSKTAAQYPVLDYLASLGVRIGNDALAMLQANPSLTPADVLTWAEKEFRLTAPDAVATTAKNLDDMGVQSLVRRGLLTAANAATVSAASQAVIAELAPKAGTVRVVPPGQTAVKPVATTVDIQKVNDRLDALEAKVAAPAVPAEQTPPAPAQATIGMGV